VSSNEDWSGAIPAVDVPNLQFTDFTVNNGITLTVPSGTVIRCSGTFTNNGTIDVATGSVGSNRGGGGGVDASTQGLAEAVAHPGVTRRSAGNGEIGDNNNQQSAGFGGPGLDRLQARLILMPGVNGGGGGGRGLSGSGSAGGGTIVVLARTGIVNTGNIFASGASAGGGGGGGGIVILASMTSINHAGGFINCLGGDGANSTSTEAACGGGGGGIIHFLAPAITSAGVTNTASGIGGFTSTLVSGARRAGGAGGGGCGGDGGTGSNITDMAGNQGGPSSPSGGYIFSTTVDPTSLF
jgi:hypothetical protein